MRKLICCVSVAVLIFTFTFGLAEAEGPFANCRLGAGGATADVVGYNLEPLNMGLYLDWRSRSSLPPGLPASVEYIQTVRVHQDKVGGWNSAYVDPPTYTVSPNLTTLANRVSASPPGSLWRIGNEIERRDWNGGGQDEMTPELYATAYHEIRNVIKAADPTARIAIGSVIEATPLRLAYLERVWDSYLNQYGYSMGQDIDVWIVHGFLLREVRHSWGAEIPAGFDNEDTDPTNDYDPTDGFLYGANNSEIMAAHHNLTYFQEFTEALRGWMAVHGERNKPLINTEYGILYNGISAAQVNSYLTESFDYLFNTTNATTGYPADENRLVQGWVWYSLNDDYWNGNLFNPTTKALTEFGTTWKNYVSDPANLLASQPRQNLLVTNLRATPNPAHVLPGNSAIITLQADIANSGNTSTTTGNNIIIVKFWDGDPSNPGSNLIGSSQILNDIPGCGRFTAVEVDWPDRAPGDHTWYVEVVPIANETNGGDNVANGTFSVVEGVPQADLEVTKTVDGSTPYTGDTIRYTIVVTNTGPDLLSDVVVTDTLPGGVSFDSYTATQGHYYYSLGRWAADTLNQDMVATLTITAEVDAGQGGQIITNTARVTSTSQFIDTNPNNISSAPIIPVANADLGLVVRANEGTDAIVFSAIVTNHGPDTATGIMVENFLLPPGLSFDSYTPSQGVYTDTSGLWEVGILADSVDAALTITATVDAGQTGNTFIVNDVIVDAREDDREPANNTASVTAVATYKIYLPIILK